jgi:hypothetical protein
LVIGLFYWYEHQLVGLGKRIDSTYQAILLCFLDTDIGIEELGFEKPCTNFYLEITTNECGIGVTNYFNS